MAKEDVALVVDADVPAAAVEAALVAGAGPLLESVRLFDVYTGEQVGDGRKSLAFALRFRAPGPHAHRRGGRRRRATPPSPPRRGRGRTRCSAREGARHRRHPGHRPHAVDAPRRGGWEVAAVGRDEAALLERAAAWGPARARRTSPTSPTPPRMAQVAACRGRRSTSWSPTPGALTGTGPVWEADPDEWWRGVEVNIRGVYTTARAVLPAHDRAREPAGSCS